MSSAVANIEIGATTNRLTRGLAQASAKFGSWALRTTSSIGSAFKKLKLGDVGKTALGTFGGNVMGRGLDMFVDAGKSTLDLERSLTRYQIATNGSAASTNAMRAQVFAVSKANGLAADQVLAGATSYVALTGDAAGASDAMSAFARIATASGASVEDIATATAALRTSMGLEAKDIEAAFSGMIVQGKAGAVEIKDMAGELAQLAPQFASAFKGGTGLEGIRDMGALFQVMRTGAGSAAQGATQFRAVMSSLSDPESVRKLKQIGIEIYGKKGEKRTVADIVEDLAKNQKLLDPRIMATVFGREETRAGLRSLQSQVGLFRELRIAARDTGAVERDRSTWLQQNAGKIEVALNNAKIAMAEAFTPERIEKFAQALSKVVVLLTKIIDGVENLFDDTGIQEMWKGDIRGAATAKYMKNTERLSPEEKRARASEYMTRAAELETAPKRDASDDLAIEGLHRAAEKLRLQGNIWGGAIPSGAVTGKPTDVAAAITGAMKEWMGAQAKELVRAMDRSNKEVVRAIEVNKPNVQIGKKEIATAAANSAQHTRGPAR